MENPYQSYMGIDGKNPLHYTEDNDEEKDDEVGKLRDVINQIREQSKEQIISKWNSSNLDSLQQISSAAIFS